MIIRIVKMTFIESQVDDFKKLVGSIRHTIQSFRGCLHLEILQDIHHKNIFFTYSYWESEADLENYRASDFFKGTWSRTSQWFKEKPRAWSTNRL